MKGGISDAENISAEEAPQKKGAWFQKKNVYCQWPQGFGKKKSQGQKAAFLLMGQKQTVLNLCVEDDGCERACHFKGK